MTQLARLIDCKGLQDELGITRAAAEAIMRELDLVRIPGLRKKYVRRNDVEKLLEDRTAA